MKNIKRDINKINLIINAWFTQAPDAKFAEKTLEEYKASVKPVMDAYAKLQEMQAEMTAFRMSLANLGKDAHEGVSLVVDSVKGTLAYGPNSPLYAAMGYIAKSKRKSGLTHKTEAAIASKANAENLKS